MTFADLHDRVIERAIAQTGLEDLGDPSFLEGFHRLVDAFGADPRIVRNRDHVISSLTEIMAGRLRSESGWHKRPEVLEAEVPRPIVIVGLPRTGTTTLHKLMSIDPRFQTLESWLIWAPQVRPPRDHWACDPDYRWAVERARNKLPRIKAAHAVEAHEPDECIRLMSQQFVSNYFGSSWPLPEYDRWFMAHDQVNTFERYADQLRLIGADQPDQPWLLKNPSHVLALDALVKVFPHARVVQTHRDPLFAIPSLCSLLAMYREAGGLDYMPTEIGRRELWVWSQAVQRVAGVRTAYPDLVIDVEYDDLLRDPVGTATVTFEALGLQVDELTNKRMRDWLAINPQGKRGEHRYTGSDYGLDEATLREAFADYRRQHDWS